MTSLNTTSTTTTISGILRNNHTTPSPMSPMMICHGDKSPSSVTMTSGGAAVAVAATSPMGHVLSPPPSRDSVAFTSTKGLLNEPGQNNCFLNSAVQVLWHLDIFRRSFRDISGHACMADSCIFCALKELFSQLQFSHDPALPPDALRRALASSFFDQQRFQLGHMDDAAECFENMLLRIHTHISAAQNDCGGGGGSGQVAVEDECNTAHCIPHQKFAMMLGEQSVCGGGCGGVSEPMSYTQMVHYVSASALTTQVRQTMATNQQNDSFGLLLKKAGSMGDIRDCPSACGSKIQIHRTLTNRPEIVSVGIVWDSERPTLDHIMDVFATLGTTLKLGDVFHNVVDKHWSESTNHNLVGVVTYYGKHYSTFFFHTKLRVWIYFDDATVREVGPRWDQVVEKCRRGRYQPLLLLYAVPNGSPVNTENAPKQITPLYTDKNTLKKPGMVSQSILRRSITPSPEKPNIGNTRRAITPNPDINHVVSQKPPLPPTSAYNDYQNLSIIQDNIYGRSPGQSQGVDVVDAAKEPQYVSRNMMTMSQFGKPQVNVHRTLSNSSNDGISIPDHLNVPRRRDSGNWSGDRNSASSASSTTMENPYLYLVGKVPPGSPTRINNNGGKSDSSTSSGVYDPGYDSYSLSSNDSSTMSTIQHLMKMGHLAKIPEDYSNANPNNNNNNLQLQPPNITITCDMLCDEADELLGKSRQLEDEHDLVLALALCNAAATKARAAMNAPYNNPQTLVLARMKHNTCIMRARSLHRRMTQTQSPVCESPIEIRHTREGSSGSGRHSRQGSRDKTGQHSRQNSKELVDKAAVSASTKSIEIYATLPKKNKDLMKNKISTIEIHQDEDFVIYTPAKTTPERESRSIFSRSKNKDQNKVKEKRSRSEDRNKISRDFSIAPDFTNVKDTIKKHKEEKEEKKDKEKSGKKQHKIRRKLLMGGLIRRKNRSMPDLTDGNINEAKAKEKLQASVDDSIIGVKGTDALNKNNMSGYLSEGHLEFTGSNTSNPNLERSKLMRKSFHGSAGKVLTPVKVPPPPPLRTTSQLSRSKLMLPNNEDDSSSSDVNSSYYYNRNTRENLGSSIYGNYMNTYEYANNNIFYGQNQMRPENNYVITQADVHQEQSPVKHEQNPINCEPMYPQTVDSGVDEVDCCLPPASLDLPPYPSPTHSGQHSRQPSEEFPPPPPPLDLSALDEHLEPVRGPPAAPGSLLAQLQLKREQILSQDKVYEPTSPSKVSGENWLKELQAKQAALRSKKSEMNGDITKLVQKLSIEPIKCEAKITSVKDLASRFEETPSPLEKAQNQYNYSKGDNTVQTGVLSLKKRPDLEISDHIPIPTSDQQIQDEIKEVEMINAVMQKTLNSGLSLSPDISDDSKRQKYGKKKSVSFCDQVILVATAEEHEDDSYIPNPILERVLRSAVHKSEANAIRQEISHLRETDVAALKTDIEPPTIYNKPRNVSPPLRPQQNNHVQQNTTVVETSHDVVDGLPPIPANNPSNMAAYPAQPYIRQNSVDSLLSRSNSTASNSQVYGMGRPNYQPLPANAQVTRIYPPQNNNEHLYSASHRGNIYPQNNIQVRQSPVPNQQYPVYQQPPQSYYNHQNTRPNEQAQQYGQYSPYQRVPNPNSEYAVYQGRPTVEEHHSLSQNHQNAIYGQQITPPHQQMIPPQIPAHQQISPHQQMAPQLQQVSHHQQMAPQPQQISPHQQMAPQHQPISPHQQLAPQLQQIPSAYQRVPQNGYSYQELQENGTIYQRIPQMEPDYNSPYQRVPNHQNYPANDTSPYQRVPPYNYPDNTPRSTPEVVQNGVYQSRQPPQQTSPYMPALVPKQILKKSVSFEPGTKGGAESPSPVPKAIAIPIVVNNTNIVPANSSNGILSKQSSIKCNLCRKKSTQGSNLYCTDCEFYMSRFKPK